MNLHYLTPGPSQLHPVVRSALDEALEEGYLSFSHRSDWFMKTYAATVSSLKKVLALPEEYQFFFMGSATEAMERILQNCCEKRSHHFVHGAFSERFHEIACELHKKTSVQRYEWQTGPALLEQPIPSDTELICLTHNETSTGVAISPYDIAQLSKANPEKLIALDIVSSAPISAIDFKLIDCAFFSVQKCFGLPAGLGVLMVSPRALARSEDLQKKGLSVGSFHSFTALSKFGSKHQTPETPNVLAIYLLGQVSDAFLVEGIEKVRQRISGRAHELYSILDSNPSGKVSAFIADPHFRSETVIAVSAHSHTNALLQLFRSNGIVVGDGYGKLKESTIRIANFPAVEEIRWREMTRILSAF